MGGIGATIATGDDVFRSALEVVSLFAGQRHVSGSKSTSILFVPHQEPAITTAMGLTLEGLFPVTRDCIFHLSNPQPMEKGTRRAHEARLGTRYG